MAKIYRYEIEHNGIGIGPYLAAHQTNEPQHELISDLLIGAHNSESYRPGIRNDVETFLCEKHFCACPTIEDLKNWFRGFNTDIINAGFRLVEYEVKTFLLGNSGMQCAVSFEDIITKKIIK